jgi:hypothetical protein
MEMRMRNGTANLNSRAMLEKPCGLRADLYMHQPKPEKPIIFTIEYIVDGIKLSNWLDSEEIEWMNIRGPIMFNAMGLRVMIPRKSQRKSNEDVSWIIDGVDGHKEVFPIKKAVRFRLHRDVLSNVEWSVYLDELP